MQTNLALRVALAGRRTRWGSTVASSSRSFISSSKSRAQAAPSPTSSEAAQPSASTSPNSKPAASPPAVGSTSSSASILQSTSSTESNSPKLTSIVDQIEGLTLLEASELVSLLKVRLNITEIAMPAASAAAPVAAAPAAAPAEEEKPKEKTIFTVKLTGLKEPTAKAKVIKEIKALNSQM